MFSGRRVHPLPLTTQEYLCMILRFPMMLLRTNIIYLGHTWHRHQVPICGTGPTSGHRATRTPACTLLPLLKAIIISKIRTADYIWTYSTARRLTARIFSNGRILARMRRSSGLCTTEAGIITSLQGIPLIKAVLISSKVPPRTGPSLISGITGAVLCSCSKSSKMPTERWRS
ncbi:hypothetical protein D3C75_695970 [compost metagenome]